MKLQGKKTGAFAGFIGYIDDTPNIDTTTCSVMLTIRYKDAGANCYKDYKTVAEFNADWEDYTEPAEPEPAYLVAKIQKLENSVKALDKRLKAQTEKMDILRDGINELHDRLKTVEEITERLLREDNEQILGEVKQYRLELPPRVVFERMKQDLRNWIEKKPKVKRIQVNFVTNEKANDGRKGVQFIDIDEKRIIANDILIWGWPWTGLADGATYTPDELLITGEAGKE